jgi:hypothetical protein
MWTPGDQVTFAVDPVSVRDVDLYKLWVANVCTQDGVTTYGGTFLLRIPRTTWGRPIRSSFQVKVGRAARSVHGFRVEVAGHNTPLGGASLSQGTSSEAPTDAGPTAKTPSACVYDS